MYEMLLIRSLFSLLRSITHAVLDLFRHKLIMNEISLIEIKFSILHMKFNALWRDSANLIGIIVSNPVEYLLPQPISPA